MSYDYDDEPSGRGMIGPVVLIALTGVGLFLFFRSRRKRKKTIAERVKDKVNAKEARKAAKKAQKAMRKNPRVKELAKSAREVRDAVGEKMNRKEAARVVHNVGDAIAGAQVPDVGATARDVVDKAKGAMNGNKKPSAMGRLVALVRR